MDLFTGDFSDDFRISLGVILTQVVEFSRQQEPCNMGIRLELKDKVSSEIILRGGEFLSGDTVLEQVVDLKQEAIQGFFPVFRGSRDPGHKTPGIKAAGGRNAGIGAGILIHLAVKSLNYMIV